MNEEFEAKWRRKDLDFICRSCAFSPSGGYNFRAALNRIHGSSSAHAELLLLSTYNIDLPDSSPDNSGHVDNVSVKILEKFHPLLLESFRPIRIIGDGNCFYRSISRAMFDTEDHHLHIRLLTAIEIFIFPEYYDTTHAEYKGPMNDCSILFEEYQTEVKSSCTPGRYAGILHFYAASAALRVCLRSYCPPVMHEHFLTTPLNKKICGRGLKETGIEQGIIMWTCTEVPKTDLHFKPNHFVIVQKKKSAIFDQQQVISCSTDEELSPDNTYDKDVNITMEESSAVEDTNNEFSDEETEELPDIDEYLKDNKKTKAESYDDSFPVLNKIND